MWSSALVRVLLLGAFGPLLLSEVRASELQEPVASSPAQAQQGGSAGRYPYYSLQVGVGLPNNYSGVIYPTIPNARENITLDLDAGVNVEAAIGYKFDDFRADVSFGYGTFANQGETVSSPAIGTAVFAGSGAVQFSTVMANLYYDMPIRLKSGSLSRWSPYVGGGVGWANVSFPNADCACYVSSSDNSFAWQAKAGLSYRATPGGAVFLEAGYFGTVNNSSSVDVAFGNFGTWRINIGWRQRLGDFGRLPQ